MTASTAIEMHLRERPPNKTPAKAVEAVLDVESATDIAERRLADLTHWSYGTAWGAVRGLLGATEPATDWAAVDLAVDAVHHAVYAAATSLA